MLGGARDPLAQHAGHTPGSAGQRRRENGGHAEGWRRGGRLRLQEPEEPSRYLNTPVPGGYGGLETLRGTAVPMGTALCAERLEIRNRQVPTGIGRDREDLARATPESVAPPRQRALGSRVLSVAITENHGFETAFGRFWGSSDGPQSSSAVFRGP